MTYPVPGTSCHGSVRQRGEGIPTIAIVGTPNVGKSLLFHALTGVYVTVSNYPGTTVELSWGTGRLNGHRAEVVDTPGMYRLLPITEEERVARRVLLEACPAAIIHVVDAKNLERMLPLTLQLMETGLPLVLDVNLLDEAERLGVKVDVEALGERLGIPVVGTVLTKGQGVDVLKHHLQGMAGGTTTSPHAWISSSLPRVH